MIAESKICQILHKIQFQETTFVTGDYLEDTSVMWWTYTENGLDSKVGDIFFISVLKLLSTADLYYLLSYQQYAHTTPITINSSANNTKTFCINEDHTLQAQLMMKINNNHPYLQYIALS